MRFARKGTARSDVSLYLIIVYAYTPQSSHLKTLPHTH